MKTGRRPRPLVAGNWKMNGARAALGELAAIGAGFGPDLRRKIDLMVCPPAPLLYLASAAVLGTGVAIGAQDCHAQASGAHTGDISASMIADCGAVAVIVGHSERRADHGETDAVVKAKAAAAMAAGLAAIVCVGETRAEREAGRTLAVVKRQLRGSVPDGSDARGLVIAYEPVWAIGTGLTPTARDVEEVHALIRRQLKALVGREEAALMRILYGGSVKPGNAAELMSVPHVDGALVGGASLTARDFLGIVEAYR
jgi:triosephosphate isomerase (TIM)